MWEHQRQEHSRMLESQASQHKMEVEELDQRLQNCEERLRQKQREVAHVGAPPPAKLHLDFDFGWS